MHINGYIIDTELRLKGNDMLFAEDPANEDQITYLLPL